MKNRIIALLLVVVMVTLALASCSEPYDYTDGNLDDYITVSDGFLAALKNIEIEDADFTTDETTRQEKVTEAIYNTLVAYAEKNGEKKTEGDMDANDIFYYAYYITYEKDGKVYSYNVDEYMKDTITTKSYVKLDAIGDDDKLSAAIKEALVFTEGKYAFNGYKTTTTTATDINKEKDKFVSAVVSYTLTAGEGEAKQVKIANAEIINLKATGDTIEAQLAKVLTDEKNKVQTFKTDNYVQVYTGTEGTTVNYSKTFDIVDGETTYTCSNLKVLFASEKAGAEIKVTQKLTAETKLTATKIDNLHPENDSVTIPKDAEVTYHIFPVHYYQVSEPTSATAIIIEALTEKVTADSLDIFKSEDYKNGEKTVKTLVEELVKVYSDNTSTKISDLKKAYEAAEKVVTDAGESATEEQKKAAADAKTAYETARDAAKNKVAEIVAAKNAEDKTVDTEIVNEYRKTVYDSLEEEYNDAIVEKVGKAIVALIEKNAVLKTTDYPEKLLEEAKAHLYNQYEHDFYTGTNSTTKVSYYSEYGGDFDAYLVAVTKASNRDGVDAKITEQAKSFILPVMRIFAVAKVLSEGSKALVDQLAIEANKDAIKDLGEHGTLRDFETLEYFAKNFYITEEVFDGYKDMVGKNEFEQSADSYGGETNIRVAHQVSNIFDYLLMLEYTANTEAEEGEHAHAKIEYKEVEGKKYLPFYNVSYSIKAEEAAE